MNNITPMTFSQKWDDTFSEKTRENHRWSAFYREIAVGAVCVATLALVVGGVALAVLGGISLELAFSMGSVAGYIFPILTAKLSQPLYIAACDYRVLASQALEITAIYERLKQDPTVSCPSGTALRDYWEKAAQKDLVAFTEIEDMPCNNSLQTKAILAAEKTAAIKKVEYVFWKVLAENNEQFERVFISPKTDLTKKTGTLDIISEFAAWDTRNTDKRLADRAHRPLVRDVLLTFHDRSIPELPYHSIFNDWTQSRVESYFTQVLSNNFQLSNEEAV
jgi:hypothetical protein